MITAKEAKALYDQSGKEVDDFLSYKVEKYVIEAAMAGKREVDILLGSLGPFEHLSNKITPLQHAVVDRLKALGYNVSIRQYGDSYVPRGLADDDGNGPSHRNYGIIINW